MPDASELVVFTEETTGASRSVIGGKALVLARLKEGGMPVPSFFVVTSHAFAAFLFDNGIHWPPSGEVSEVRERIAAGTIAPSLAEPIGSAVEKLAGAGAGKVAVRSSGAEEDSASSSFAGQFSSFLGVAPGEVLDSVKACWASYLSERSIAYRALKRLPPPERPLFGVIVQRQILAHKAGVLYTVHPLDSQRRRAYIEANFGTGESVVGGLTEPDGLTIARASGKVVERKIGRKRWMTSVSPQASGSITSEMPEDKQLSPVLHDGEAEELYRMGARIEKLQGAPQDVEWCFDDAGLWILQSRPIPPHPSGRR